MYIHLLMFSLYNDIKYIKHVQFAVYYNMRDKAFSILSWNTAFSLGNFNLVLIFIYACILKFE